MSHRAIPTVALSAFLAACGTPATARRELPPPARESRAGVREPVAGPAAPLLQPRTTPPATARAGAAQAAVEAARGQLGRREIVVGEDRFGDDCAALVRAALSRAGSPLPPGVRTAAGLHAFARDRGLLRRSSPAAGDLIFLADRPGGAPAHVGIVEAIGSDGTVHVLHGTARGVARLRVNAERPSTLRGPEGRLVNDPLVTAAGRLPAGKLFLAWASLV